jgi:two-component system NarL family response regulator
MRELRILLADDHALFRDGVASLLRAWGVEIVGEVSTGAQAIEQALRLRPDLILMDIKMPGTSGLEAAARIKRELPETKIVMLTMSEDEHDLLEAVRAGADGYLLKNLSGAEFAAMLRGIAEGEIVASQSLAGKLLTELARSVRPQPAAPSPTSLSERERAVLELIARGATSREIAQELVISENTVNFHVRNILGKLNARTRSEAVARALQEGLVEPGDHG